MPDHGCTQGLLDEEAMSKENHPDFIEASQFLKRQKELYVKQKLVLEKVILLDRMP